MLIFSLFTYRMSSSTEISKQEAECLKLYGPYPKAIPVPFLDKAHTQTPSKDKIAKAER